MTHLSKLVDDACLRGAVVREGLKTVIVANLTARDACAIVDACEDTKWTVTIVDAHESSWAKSELTDDLAPFRATIWKPAQDDVLPVLSRRGFEQLLGDPTIQSSCWAVAGLAAPIRTWSISFLPWGKTEKIPEPVPTKNPRFLVKEYTTERCVPSEVGRWLLRAPTLDRGVADDYRQTWAEAASVALVSCLPNEIDPETGALRFRGPPRLSLTRPPAADLSSFAGSPEFDVLQLACTWVFENVRDTETRHALLASELARSGMDGSPTTLALERDLEPALEGARIAYEMALAAVGADTLKALSDLRKAVTEETAKVTEATRQTVTAVSSALAVGIGLIAAKATSSVSISLIGGLMAVALVYVVMVASSGWQFVALQRKARENWQQRLYRFLPAEEYKRLVTEPTDHAERAFRTAAVLGLSAVLILAGVLYFVEREGRGSAVPPSNAAEHSELQPQRQQPQSSAG